MIQLEVGFCLTQCERSREPLLALAEYLDKLRRCGWCKEDLRRIERPVMQVLAKLVALKPGLLF
jgi:hypothetical protein